LFFCRPFYHLLVNNSIFFLSRQKFSPAATDRWREEPIRTRTFGASPPPRAAVRSTRHINAPPMKGFCLLWKVVLLNVYNRVAFFLLVEGMSILRHRGGCTQRKPPGFRLPDYALRLVNLNYVSSLNDASFNSVLSPRNPPVTQLAFPKDYPEVFASIFFF